MNVDLGTYLVIRVDGTEELVKQKPTMGRIHAAIGCECIDAVTLDRNKQIVMLVDDTGMVDGKPVNQKATARYHAVRATLYSIHGDVAIVNDEDFA